MTSDNDKQQQVELLEKELNQLCPNLYFDKQHQSYCPKYGWKDIVSTMSLKFEMLDRQLKRYGVKAVIQQCKDKYGQLRVYIDVIQMTPKWASAVIDALFCMHKWLDKRFDYKMKKVVDVPAFTQLSEEKIDKVEYDVCKQQRSSNVKYVERDGEFWRQGAYAVMQKLHIEPTAYICISKLSSFLLRLSHKITVACQCKKQTADQRFAMQYAELASNEIVNEAEKASLDVCERCGTSFGDHGFNTHCVTQGWVMNLCRSCAENSGERYFMDGALYEGQKRIMSKEDVSKRYGDCA